MAVKKITLNEDHLKLISAIKFEVFDFDEKESFSKLKRLARQLNLVDVIEPEMVDERTREMIKDYSEVNNGILDEINE